MSPADGALARSPHVSGRRALLLAGVALAHVVVGGCRAQRTTDDVIAEHRLTLVARLAELSTIVDRLPSAPPAVHILRVDGPPSTATNTVIVAAEDRDVLHQAAVARLPVEVGGGAAPPTRTERAVRDVIDALRLPPSTVRSARPRAVEALEADVAHILFARYVGVVRTEPGTPSSSSPAKDGDGLERMLWHGSVALFDRHADRWVGCLEVTVPDERPSRGSGRALAAAEARAADVRIERTIRRALEAGWSQRDVLTAAGAGP